ncbi:hypothetical protein [uncultured Rikenella sp.]|nr:hypothetical protein [uncultured Rikenella sp.]
MRVGHYGYSWSSTIGDTSSMCLDFHMTWLSPHSAYYRAYSFQLRCLSE